MQNDFKQSLAQKINSKNTHKITSEKNTQTENKKTGLKLKDVKVEDRARIVELAAAPEKIIKHVSLFEELKRRLLSEKDYQEIAGKRYIKKSGWRMFALAFNLSDEILKEERKIYKINNQEYFAWEVTVKVTAPNGRSACATASCASNEKKFTHAEHDVRATAHTRAKNRAVADLIGGGEVSAEEIDAPLYSGTERGESLASSSFHQEDELATPKQLSFIKRLAAEKKIEKIAEATGVAIDEDVIPTKRQASEIIEKLMAL